MACAGSGSPTIFSCTPTSFLRSSRLTSWLKRGHSLKRALSRIRISPGTSRLNLIRLIRVVDNDREPGRKLALYLLDLSLIVRARTLLSKRKLRREEGGVLHPGGPVSSAREIFWKKSGWSPRWDGYTLIILLLECGGWLKADARPLSDRSRKNLLSLLLDSYERRSLGKFARSPRFWLRLIRFYML